MPGAACRTGMDPFRQPGSAFTIAPFDPTHGSPCVLTSRERLLRASFHVPSAHKDAGGTYPPAHLGARLIARTRGTPDGVVHWRNVARRRDGGLLVTDEIRHLRHPPWDHPDHLSAQSRAREEGRRSSYTAIVADGGARRHQRARPAYPSRPYHPGSALGGDVARTMPLGSVTSKVASGRSLACQSGWWSRW